MEQKPTDGGNQAQPVDEETRVRFDYAQKLAQLGVELLLHDKTDAALETFNESISTEPTAEGYTYRGWAASTQGRLQEAIGDCLKAIAVDADLGNPYNDIGVYLMQLGRIEEAVPWLRQATLAKRYEARHFPYLNLGHIYMLQGRQNKALDAYMAVLDLDPDNASARKAVASMDFVFV